jgi:hypothetical protein
LNKIITKNQKIEAKKDKPSYGREEVIDELTEENLKDMESITNIHNKLDILNKACKNIEESDKNAIAKTSDEIFQLLNLQVFE